MTSLVLASLALALPLLVQGKSRTEDVAREIDRYLEPLVESQFFSGSVLIAQGGQVLVGRGYGKAHVGRDTANTASTLYKIMSVTKAITAVGVMALVDSGKLSIDDPVGKHLRPWPEAWAQVRIRHLLSHTSGIPNLEREWAMHARTTKKRGLTIWPGLAKQVEGRSLQAVPGKQGGYSNFNFVLLGLVIEAASGKSYPEFMKSAVFEPVGMKHTGIDDGSRRPGLAMGYFRGSGGTLTESAQDMSVIEAAGGIYTTAGELYRLDRALYRDDLLSAKTRKLMYTPITKYFACGWRIAPDLGRPCIQHSGGANGYVADFLRFPEDDACVIVLSNFAVAPIGRISHDLARILFGLPYDRPQKADPAILDAYAGVYRGQQRGGYAMMIRRSGNALLAFEVRPNQHRCGGRLLLPLADRAFAPPFGDAKITFDTAEDGSGDRVEIQRAGRTTTLLRAAVDLAPWRRALGSYAVTPAGLGAVELVGKGGNIELRVTGGWPPRATLAPISTTAAIALVSDTFGTLLRLDSGGFSWQRADGITLRGRRR